LVGSVIFLSLYRMVATSNSVNKESPTNHLRQRRKSILRQRRHFGCRRTDLL